MKPFSYAVALVIWLVLAGCGVERLEDAETEAAEAPTPTAAPTATATPGGTPSPADTVEPPSPTATGEVPTPMPTEEVPLSTATAVVGREEPSFSDYQEGFFVVVDNPALIPAAESALGDDDLVLGYEQDGEARAYPIGMVAYHHIINDTFRGRPLLVTY